MHQRKKSHCSDYRKQWGNRAHYERQQRRDFPIRQPIKYAVLGPRVRGKQRKQRERRKQAVAYDRAPACRLGLQLAKAAATQRVPSPEVCYDRGGKY
jgi:hypothetical protein